MNTITETTEQVNSLSTQPLPTRVNPAELAVKAAKSYRLWIEEAANDLGPTKGRVGRAFVHEAEGALSVLIALYGVKTVRGWVEAAQILPPPCCLVSERKEGV